MDTQLSAAVPRSRRSHLEVLRGGGVLPLGTSGGRLEVLHGRVWLTRAGDPDDHVVDHGQSIVVPASGRALVSSVDDARTALIAWRPRSIAERAIERVVAATRSVFGRCWEIVEPAPRIGAGALAAVLVVFAGVLVFGPISDARTRALATAAVLHNGDAATARPGAHARTLVQRLRTDAAADERALGAAPQARRRATGVA